MIKYVIIMQKDGVIKVITSITRICEDNPEFTYSYLRNLKFPYEYKGWRFDKVAIER